MQIPLLIIIKSTGSYASKNPYGFSTKYQDGVKTRIINMIMLKSADAKDLEPEAKGRELGFTYHTIEDSYCASHTSRTEKFKITRFQNYLAQDSSRHAEADINVKALGYGQAIAAVTEMMKLTVCNPPDSGKLYDYLDLTVLKFADGVAEAGGSACEYATEEYLNGKGRIQCADYTRQYRVPPQMPPLAPDGFRFPRGY